MELRDGDVLVAPSALQLIKFVPDGGQTAEVLLVRLHQELMGSQGVSHSHLYVLSLAPERVQ